MNFKVAVVWKDTCLNGSRRNPELMPKKASRWKRWTKIFRPKAVRDKLAWGFTIALNVLVIVGSLNQGNGLRFPLVMVLLFFWWMGLLAFYTVIFPGFAILTMLFEVVVDWEIKRREKQKKKR